VPPVALKVPLYVLLTVPLCKAEELIANCGTGAAATTIEIVSDCF
jgi:hypothetical protein